MAEFPDLPQVWIRMLPSRDPVPRALLKQSEKQIYRLKIPRRPQEYNLGQLVSDYSKTGLETLLGKQMPLAFKNEFL